MCLLLPEGMAYAQIAGIPPVVAFHVTPRRGEPNTLTPGRCSRAAPGRLQSRLCARVPNRRVRISPAASVAVELHHFRRVHPAFPGRVTGTIDAISRDLGRDGFVSRYSIADTDDGLPGDEGQFLACSFWLVSALALNGRVEEARALFERLIGLTNELGLLAEVRRETAAAGCRHLSGPGHAWFLGMPNSPPREGALRFSPSLVAAVGTR
jgi:hypothetical protein